MSTPRPIPKFGSFKPKEAPSDAVSASKQTTESSSGDWERKERRRHHHHRRHRSKSRDRPEAQLVGAPVSVPVPKDDTSELFIEDRRGDPKNLVYGSLHRYSVSAFHRIGAGAVLGAARGLKIEKGAIEDKGIVLSDRKDERKSEREKYIFARNEKKAVRLLKIRPDVTEEISVADNQDYVSLRRSRPKERRRSNSQLDLSSDDDKHHYRSIEGKAKPGTEPLDEGLEWASDSDSSDPESGRTFKFDEAQRQKTIQLSRRVDDFPQDMEAWLALIDHQDNLLGWANGERRKVTNAERRSTADIKLHIYEKALARAGTTLANRERLLLGLMREGEKIWDFKTQSERWEQVSRENLDSVLLWKQYLDFRQCAFVAFRYEEVRNIYISRIKLMKTVIAKEGKSEEEIRVLFESLIYTILRATLFMRESGYSELAVAIWQALLEFNFFAPLSLSPGTSQLDSFQKFWDSEVLRIGEEGAVGWRNVNVDTEEPDPKVDEDHATQYSNLRDVMDAWATAEKSKAAASRMPARTMDETTEDDPYRLILWSDIEDYIVNIPTRLSTDLSHLLLDAFLIFCRLPPIAATDGCLSRAWWIDSFTKGELLDCSKDWALDEFNSPSSMEVSDMEPASNPFKWPFHYFAGSVDSLFPSKYWAGSLVPWRSHFLADSSGTEAKTEIEGPVMYSWLRNVLKSLLSVSSSDIFAEYYLAFEFCNEPLGIKKVAKNILKQNSQSLRLYNAYAMIEWTRGNEDIATNVIKTALGMRSSLSEKEQENSILLWRTWAWALLEDGNDKKALQCLFTIAAGNPSHMSNADLASPVALLKAKQHISSRRDYLLSSGNVGLALMYAECLALIQYLTSDTGQEMFSQDQGDIASALPVFDSLEEELTARRYGLSKFHELTLQSIARLLHHHVRAGPFRPAFLRTHLTRCLTFFPQNTIFLSLYAWNESRLRIDDRVREVLRDIVLTDENDNIISRLFAIRNEMRAGNVHSTHAAFENAVTSPQCRSNPGLWRLFVLFCERTKEFANKAKETFYRGMRACPWAKEFMMMAFADLRGLGMEEKISVFRVLGEKELRIHVDLELQISELQEREPMALDARA